MRWHNDRKNNTKAAADIKKGGGVSRASEWTGQDVGDEGVASNGEKKHKGWPRTAAKVLSTRN